MNIIPQEVLQPVQALVYQSCLSMNAEAWGDYLSLCDSQCFRYRVTNYSPEIRREQCWADRDFKTMKAAFDLMPRHNADKAKLTRHANVYSVTWDAGAREASVVSALTIYRTELDGATSYRESGLTRLYVVGLYRDRIRLTDAGARLVDRIVELDTRQLDIGTHKPF